jgi:methyl-accepting chemotaxis protein
VPKLNLKGLKAQIGLAAGLPLVAALIILAVGMSGLRDVKQRLDELVQVSTAKSDIVAEMRLGIVARADAVRNIALTDEIDAMKPDRDRIVALAKRHGELRERLERLATSAEEKTLLQAAAAAEDKALPLIKEAQAMAQLMQLETAAKVLSAKLGPVQKEWMQALDGLADLGTRERERAMDAAGNTAQRASTVMLVAAGCAVLACVLSTALIARRSIRRLGLAVSAAEAIAEGQLAAPIDQRGDDEIASVLRAVAQMQKRLRETIETIRDGIGSLSTASGEIAAGNSDLSVRTEQQASNLQQTAASMEEITGAVGNSAESARQAKQLAGTASQVARRGGEAMDQAVRTMQEIHASSAKMSDIIGVIDGIAFQTNILALNAAVEAARAGEQGRGFAVVASEVRSLAQRSAQAAKEIKALIDASVDKATTGSQMVTAMGTTMGDIVAQVQRVDQLIGEISDAAQEQTSGIGQVNTSITQLDEMTQQNAALVEQGAAAAESLRTQATRLTEAVAVFRTEGRAGAGA